MTNTTNQTITREPGAYGDHCIIDEAIKRGHTLTPGEEAFHNWDGGYSDIYDLAIDRAATRAIHFLESNGFTVIA